MISVENFYWILYENLLRPVNLGIRYCYPFGTTDSVIKNEYDGVLNPRYDAHAFFHFDQEPIYHVDDPAMIKVINANYKFARILANSEVSAVKKETCRRHQFLDWYFFYHGFASLNWFAAAKFIDREEPIDNAFCSFNHLVRKRRSYRMALTARLASRDLLAQGQISFHGSHEICSLEIDDPDSELCDQDCDLIKKYLVDKKLQPLVVDHKNIDGSFSARLGIHEYRMQQRSFLHLVNETVFYEPKKHLTEKIFKPIVCVRPFILVGAPHNLEYLRSYGFKTFDQWIDESYDIIENPADRLDHICNEIDRISRLPMSKLQTTLKEMRPVLEHNKRHFFGQFRNLIVNELVDNFDQCIRIWNNGRIDDRRLPTHPDLDLVKQILLR